MKRTGNLKRRLLVLNACLMVMIPCCGADDWNAHAVTPPAGLSERNWQHLVSHLQQGSYTFSGIEPCLTILEQAHDDALPLDALVSRFEEAVAKTVPSKKIHQSLAKRLESLRNAKRLLINVGLEPSVQKPYDQLIVAIASASESGVHERAMESVLSDSAGDSSCHIQMVIEAGELLKLAGIEDANIDTLMRDFHDRSLCCSEILRVVRLVAQRHRDGIAPEAILENLWVPENIGNPSGGLKTCPASRL